MKVVPFYSRGPDYDFELIISVYPGTNRVLINLGHRGVSAPDRIWKPITIDVCDELGEFYDTTLPDDIREGITTGRYAAIQSHDVESHFVESGIVQQLMQHSVCKSRGYGIFVPHESKPGGQHHSVVELYRDDGVAWLDFFDPEIAQKFRAIVL